MTTSTLTSLAILKVNWDHLGVDYVENFVPFIVECARISADDVVSLPNMQNAVSERFGLTLPQNAIRMIIVRATKRGYFRRVSGVIYKNQEFCETLNFRETKDAVEATYHRVVSSLRNYASESHGKKWSDEETENALLEFLTDSSLSLLFEIAEGKKGVADARKTRYVVASFVEEVKLSDQNLLDDLALLARGNLLANAMYLPDPGRISKRFKRTQVYFDTSLIMFAAGFAGPDRAAPCLELFELLSQYGAELRCFTATRTELQVILDTCASRLQRGRLRDAYGPTIEYFIESGKSASDLELMSARLPGKLKALGIRIVDTPIFDDIEFQVDEKGFEKQLEESIGYAHPTARVHDVDCISAIARLRCGRQSRDVEECKAIFITTNTALARTTRYFFQRDAAPGATALAVTDYAIANLLWLKNPTAAPDLPRKMLLADAYAATQPPANLWKKYLAEIARLEDNGGVTTDEYLLLRHSMSAKAALMDLTDGQEDIFTEGSVRAILEVAKENVRADLRAEVETQRKRRLESEEELRGAKEEAMVQRQRLRRVAAWLGMWVQRILFVSACLLLTFGVIATFPWELPSLPTAWQKYVVPVALVLVAALSLGNLILGTTLRDLADWLESGVTNSVTKLLFKFAGLPDATTQSNKKYLRIDSP